MYLMGWFWFAFCCCCFVFSFLDKVSSVVHAKTFMPSSPFPEFQVSASAACLWKPIFHMSVSATRRSLLRVRQTSSPVGKWLRRCIMGDSTHASQGRLSCLLGTI